MVVSLFGSFGLVPLRGMISQIVAVVTGIGMIAVMDTSVATAAQTEEAPTADTSQPSTTLDGVVAAPVSVIRAPGGGYWLRLADGSLEAVGELTAPVDPNELSTPPPAAPPEPARLAGVMARQLFGRGASDLALSCTGEFSLASRVGLTLMPAVDAALLDELLEPVAAGLVGGVVVLGEPDPSIGSVIALLRGATPISFLVAVDEEGGRVQRLRAVLGPLPSAAAQAGAGTAAEVESLIADHGLGMRELGFDLALAPVLDVGGGPGIGDRAYGDAIDEVVDYGLAVAAGFESAGLVPVVKHFPGHGRASADTHLALATTPPIDEVRAVDLEPFRAAIEAGIQAVMVGHLDVPGLTDGVPASLSPVAVNGLLRGELGFDGLVMTDALNMAAVADTWTTPEAVELALAAGADVMILGDASEIDAIHARISDAVEAGRLDDTRITQAATHALRAAATLPCTLLAGGDSAHE